MTFDTSFRSRPRSSRVSPLLLAVSVAALAAACAKPNTAAPGLEGMGSPGISWAAKSAGQKMGFMAAWVHPRSEQLFVEHDGSYKGSFTCATCHGENAELNDYEMPSEDLYPLPRENALAESMEYDAEVTDFMQNTLTVQMNVWMNQGEGPKEQVTCFSCHPIDE